MNFASNIQRRQAASFGGLKIVTRDAHVCQKQLREGLKGNVFLWSVASGLWTMKTNGNLVVKDADLKDPHEMVIGLATRLKELKGQSSFVFCDLDYWMEDDPVIRRHIVEAVQFARTKGHLLIFLSRHTKLHPELADELTTLIHPLPDRAASRQELTKLLTDADIHLSEEEHRNALDSVQGLTSSRQADAFSLGIVDFLIQQASKKESPAFDVGVLRRYKEEEVGKLGFLKVSEPDKSFNDLIGHTAFKDWLEQRKYGFLPEARQAALPVPRGMLLVGPPGTGKSRFAEATAKEWGYPFLTLDVGSLFGGILGESESNADMAMEIAEKMSPCVLLIDEVEQAFGGDKGSGDRDGGTTARVIGKFLTWMAAKTAPVFVVFTSNEASTLPAQMIRKGRLDSIFFLDFPSEEERSQVFEYYLKKGPYNLDNPKQQLKDLVAHTTSWSPAEIEAAVGDARYTAFADGQRPLRYSDIQEEIEKAVPVHQSMSQQVARMREWAKQYARSTQHIQKPDWAGSARRIIDVGND